MYTYVLLLFEYMLLFIIMSSPHNFITVVTFTTVERSLYCEVDTKLKKRK